jgi:hypothetical protein
LFRRCSGVRGFLILFHKTYYVICVTI